MQIGLQVGRAIGHIHQKKIIHRDIKPENVNVDAFGRAKLMDFGIAKADNMRLTRTGMTLGTPYLHVARTSARPGRHDTSRHLFLRRAHVRIAHRQKSPSQGENYEKIFHKILYDPLDLEPLHEAAVAPAAIDLITQMPRQAPRRPPAKLRESSAEPSKKPSAKEPCSPARRPLRRPPPAQPLPPMICQRFCKPSPLRLRTSGGLAFLGGIATLLVMAAIYFALRLARVI